MPSMFFLAWGRIGKLRKDLILQPSLTWIMLQSSCWYETAILPSLFRVLVHVFHGNFLVLSHTYQPEAKEGSYRLREERNLT